MARLGHNLRRSYLEANEVLPRTYQRLIVLTILVLAVALPLVASHYTLHLMNLCMLGAVAALGLTILTGCCGQISLGHAAFLAIGAFTTVILNSQLKLPFLLVVPSAAVAGALIGMIVGLPSLRFRGVYLAISTIAMHYAIIFLATSYQANFGGSASAGITIPDPSIGSLVLSGDRAWYFFLLGFLVLVTIAVLNLVRTRPGRAWMAIRDRDIAAQALGINVARFKLLAFMTSAMLAAVAGSLGAYLTNVVTVESYSLDLAIVYVAIVVVGGMGSVTGTLLGAFFITLLPYGVDAVFDFLPRSWRFGSTVSGVKAGVVGLCIILFLLFEPKGLAEIWRRIETYFDRWPFRYRPLDASRR